MRDRDRDLWSVGSGTFLSHSERPLSGLDCLSIQRLDALLYTEGKGLLINYATMSMFRGRNTLIWGWYKVEINFINKVK